MATDTQHLEGISLQAERVVRAFHNFIEKSKAEADGVSLEGIGGLFVQLRALEGWLEPVESESDNSAPGLDALDRARGDAQLTAREIREIISAAQTVDDDVSGDSRIRACLDVASRQLGKLVNELDSVNFGTGGGA